MLVVESFVDAHVVVAPAEMAGCPRLDTCSRASGDGVYHYVLIQHQVLGQREEPQLDAGGKTAGIGYMFGFARSPAVQFGQTVDEVMFRRSDTVIHGKVDDP